MLAAADGPVEPVEDQRVTLDAQSRDFDHRTGAFFGHDFFRHDGFRSMIRRRPSTDHAVLAQERFHRGDTLAGFSICRKCVVPGIASYGSPASRAAAPTEMRGRPGVGQRGIGADQLDRHRHPRQLDPGARIAVAAKDVRLEFPRDMPAPIAWSPDRTAGSRAPSVRRPRAANGSASAQSSPRARPGRRSRACGARHAPRYRPHSPVGRDAPHGRAGG